MKRRRIFIAINLPEFLKKRLIEFQKKQADLPFHWTKEMSLHLTVVFIGWVTDEQMLETCELVKQAAKKFESFEIVFNRLCYGPPGKPPRMIWLEGEPNVPLASMQKVLEDILFKSEQGSGSKQEARPYRPHITVGRLKNGAPTQDLSPLSQKVDYRFSVESIEVMESHLQGDGAEYVILESAELEGDRN